MGLYERVTKIGLTDNTTKIPVHAFMAVLGEIERGQMTQAQAATNFSLSAGEQTELATLVTKILSRPEAYPLGAYTVLTDVGTAYDAIPQVKGLGFVAVDTLGITRLEIRFRYNKIGTGTLTWQLWNETDTQEVGFVDDASAAGDNKMTALVVTPASPLGVGVKLLRPRVKSTVAGDDPVYYGACMFLRRVSLVTSAVLHEILLAAEQQVVPLNTIPLVKARLGV